MVAKCLVTISQFVATTNRVDLDHVKINVLMRDKTVNCPSDSSIDFSQAMKMTVHISKQNTNSRLFSNSVKSQSLILVS